MTYNAKMRCECCGKYVYCVICGRTMTKLDSEQIDNENMYAHKECKKRFDLK